MVIGPLHLDIHWKKTNKQKITILNYVSSLFVLSQCMGSLLSSMAVL